MAETRDLIVRSNNIGNTKSFIRIGDESPLSVSETGSSLQFLQNLSSSLCTFDTAGTTSAFRIRHDTVNGYLIFEGRSGSNGPYQLMKLNDDTNTVTFGGTVAFEDISFDQITGSHLYVGTSSRLLGTTSISFLSMTSSLGTASIWYDASTTGVTIEDGKLYLKSGATTTSIIYDASTTGVTIEDGLIHLGTGSSTSSLWNDQSVICSDNKLNINNHITSSALRVNGSIAHGIDVITSGNYSHAHGIDVITSGNYSHAQGAGVIATGNYSHAQGYGTIASGEASHAQGAGVIATGNYSHAQGYGTIASGEASHAQGLGTTTSIGYQHAAGKYNAVDNNAIFIVGVGTSDDVRANGFWVTKTGQANARLGFSSSGYLKIAGQSTMSNALVQNMLQVGPPAGTGRYYQSIGEDPNAFSIWAGADGTHPIHVNGDSKFILFDSAGGGYKVGIGVDNPTEVLEVLNVIAVTNSQGSVKLAVDYTGGELGVIDNFDNAIAVKMQDGTFRYGGYVYDPYLIIENGSLRSNTYASGFAGNGWSISKSTVPSTRYTAVFDDLWVRGSMNVYQMVINQIRATNGSLWVSDAGKATSASYSSATNTLILSFQTGSLVPFIAGDILRSKRWGLSGSTTQSQWDITTTVSSVNYASGYVTLSAPTINNLYTVTGSANGTWTQLAERLSNSGSQWVRVGNTGSNLDRRGSIYITSTDLGGPFLDVYDGVETAGQATEGTSGSVNPNNTKVRLGQLNGIVDSAFGGALSGYGLYADNVYLRGTISATAGTFSGLVTAATGSIGGWNINATNITTSGIQFLSGASPAIKIGASGYSGNGIWLGKGNYYSASFWNTSLARGLKWDGQKLIVSASNFSLDTNGKISANQAVISGSISSSAGQIGQWTISQNAVSANGVTLSSGTNPYIGIGTATHNGTGIFLGKSNNASMSIWSDNNRGLTWNGSALIISGSNFTLSSEGSISASNAVIGGTIYANSGKIGDTNGWAIGPGKLSSANSQIFLTSSAAYPSLRIYTTSAPSSYNSGYKNYIYLGLYSSVPKFQLIGNTNYFKWDSTKSTIKADNFELNESGTIIANNAIISGSISSSAGSIGGWNINSSGITAAHPTGIISVTKQGSTILQLIDQNGNFLYSDNNTSLFNSIIDYYQKKQDYTKLTVYTGVSTSIATVGETWSGVGYNVQQQGVSFYNLFTYTVSGLTQNKQYILQLNMHNFKVDGDAGYQGSRYNYKSPSFIWAWISDLPGATPVQESVGGQYVMNPLFNLGEQGIKQFKFTATAQEMYIKSMYTLRHLDNNVHTTSFTFSGFRIDEFQHFTELSDKGLIVFNNPSNYLQLSSGDDIDNASNGAIDSFNINKLNVNQVHIQDPKYRNAPVFVDVYTESLSSNLYISSSLLLSMGGFNTDQVNVSVPVQVQVYRLTDTVWTQVTDYPVRLKSLANFNLLSRIEIDLPESSGTYSVATTFRVV